MTQETGQMLEEWHYKMHHKNCTKCGLCCSMLTDNKTEWGIELTKKEIHFINSSLKNYERTNKDACPVLVKIGTENLCLVEVLLGHEKKSHYCQEYYDGIECYREKQEQIRRWKKEHPNYKYP